MKPKNSKIENPRGCSSNFRSTPPNLPFLAKNSQICEEEHKITAVDTTKVSNI